MLTCAKKRMSVLKFEMDVSFRMISVYPLDCPAGTEQWKYFEKKG